MSPRGQPLLTDLHPTKNFTEIHDGLLLFQLSLDRHHIQMSKEGRSCSKYLQVKVTESSTIKCPPSEFRVIASVGMARMFT